MGFASTASYFESRANSERDPDRQRLFEEIAGFYRKLAGIAPDFPQGYRPNAKDRSRANRWQERAEECRAMADRYGDPKCREQMEQLAKDYAQMAIDAG
jgi:hypothetical protein